MTRRREPAGAAVPAAMMTILSAIDNAGGGRPVTAAMVLDMLRTGRGDPSHLRALFGDVALAAIERVAAGAGIASNTVFRAYRRARAAAAVENEEINALQAAASAAEKASMGFTAEEPT